jgi:hypothetical protein
LEGDFRLALLFQFRAEDGPIGLVFEAPFQLPNDGGRGLLTQVIEPGAIVHVPVNIGRVSRFATRAAQGIAVFAGGDQDKPTLQLL